MHIKVNILNNPIEGIYQKIQIELDMILEKIFDKFLRRHSSTEKEYIIIMICLIDFLNFRKDREDTI